MGKAYANRKKKADRPKADFYGTPISLVWELLKVEREKFEYSTILEPACGKLNIINALKGKERICNLSYFDLYHGKKKQDFLKYKTKHDTIITNPPFSQFDDFVMHAKEIADHVFMIGKTNFFGAYKRNKIGVWENLKKIYVFNRQVDYRTPYRKNGCFNVGNLVTGWFIWERGYTGKTTHEVMDVNKYATLGAYKTGLKKAKVAS